MSLICAHPSRPSSPPLALHIPRKWEGQHNHSSAAWADSASWRQSRSRRQTRPKHLSSDARLVRAVDSCRQRPRQRRPRPPARPRCCPRPPRRSSGAPKLGGGTWLHLRGTLDPSSAAHPGYSRHLPHLGMLVTIVPPGARDRYGAAPASCPQSRPRSQTRPQHTSSDARRGRAVERSCHQRPRQRRPRPPARPRWCPRPPRGSNDAPSLGRGARLHHRGGTSFGVLGLGRLVPHLMPNAPSLCQQGSQR